MRRFVIIGHRADTTGNFKLDDVCGGAGRLDVLIRCVNSAFFLSHSIRRDVEVFLILQGGEDAPKTIRFCGDDLRYLNPDERSTASLIRNALLKKVAEKEIRASPGIYVSRKSFEEILVDLAKGGELLYLKENGKDIRDVRLEGDLIFVLGDDRDLSKEEERILSVHASETLSLGPASYHSDHCITLVNNELDRRGL